MSSFFYFLPTRKNALRPTTRSERCGEIISMRGDLFTQNHSVTVPGVFVILVTYAHCHDWAERF
jgi:hypothetical protein